MANSLKIKEFKESTREQTNLKTELILNSFAAVLQIPLLTNCNHHF